jgi:hypothetical protein
VVGGQTSVVKRWSVWDDEMLFLSITITQTSHQHILCYNIPIINHFKISPTQKNHSTYAATMSGFIAGGSGIGMGSAHDRLSDHGVDVQRHRRKGRGLIATRAFEVRSAMCASCVFVCWSLQMANVPHNRRELRVALPAKSHRRHCILHMRLFRASAHPQLYTRAASVNRTARPLFFDFAAATSKPTPT